MDESMVVSFETVDLFHRPCHFEKIIWPRSLDPSVSDRTNRRITQSNLGRVDRRDKRLKVGDEITIVMSDEATLLPVPKQDHHVVVLLDGVPDDITRCLRSVKNVAENESPATKLADTMRVRLRRELDAPNTDDADVSTKRTLNVRVKRDVIILEQVSVSSYTSKAVSISETSFNEQKKKNLLHVGYVRVEPARTRSWRILIGYSRVSSHSEMMVMGKRFD